MRFGEYEVVSRDEIEGGGFDALATDPLTGKPVRLWVGAEGSGAALEGAPEELGRRLSRIYQASLPRVLASAVVADRVVVKTQPYEGESLARRLERGRPGVLESLDIAKAIGAALVKAHAAGVVHGALSESEILLAPGGRALLLHLGLGPYLGPREPRAPEDGPGSDRSASGDVFGLSRVLWRCLLAEDPWSPDRAPEASVTGEEPLEAVSGRLPADLPEGLRRFLARAAHPDPTIRIHRAEEFAGDLRVIRASWDSLSAPPPAPTVPLLLLGRPRLALLGALVLAAAGVIFGLRACGS